jgi:hypothetical protein
MQRTCRILDCLQKHTFCSFVFFPTDPNDVRLVLFLIRIQDIHTNTCEKEVHLQKKNTLYYEQLEFRHQNICLYVNKSWNECRNFILARGYRLCELFPPNDNRPTPLQDLFTKGPETLWISASKWHTGLYKDFVIFATKNDHLACDFLLPSSHRLIILRTVATLDFIELVHVARG